MVWYKLPSRAPRNWLSLSPKLLRGQLNMAASGGGNNNIVALEAIFEDQIAHLSPYYPIWFIHVILHFAIIECWSRARLSAVYGCWKIQTQRLLTKCTTHAKELLAAKVPLMRSFSYPLAKSWNWSHISYRRSCLLLNVVWDEKNIPHHVWKQVKALLKPLKKYVRPYNIR